MESFFRFLDRVDHSLKWVCTALVIGLALLVFSSVLFRYLLNSPIEWADEVVGFFILGLTYFGSAVACSRRSQIYVEILESALKKAPGALRWVRIAVDTVVMIALVAMVFVGLATLRRLPHPEDRHPRAELLLRLPDHAGRCGLHDSHDDQKADPGHAERASSRRTLQPIRPGAPAARHRIRAGGNDSC